MSALSDKAILQAISDGSFFMDPITHNNIQPGSIDLTLHNEIDVFCPDGDFDPNAMDKGKLNAQTQKITIPSGGYKLAPGDFVTGYSSEIIRLAPVMNGCIFNRNSLARHGLDASISSYVNPGFHGRKVIVIRNMGKTAFVLHAGMRICQLVLFKLDAEAIRNYGERHSLEGLMPAVDEYLRGTQVNTADGKPENTALSDFLQQRIDEIAQR